MRSDSKAPTCGGGWNAWHISMLNHFLYPALQSPQQAVQHDHASYAWQWIKAILIVSGLPTVLLMGTPIRRSTRSAERLKAQGCQRSKLRNENNEGQDGRKYQQRLRLRWLGQVIVQEAQSQFDSESNISNVPTICQLWCDAQTAPGQKRVHQNVAGHDIWSGFESWPRQNVAFQLHRLLQGVKKVLNHTVVSLC